MATPHAPLPLVYGDVYLLVNLHHGGALDLDEDTMEVVTNPPTGAATQQWRIVQHRGRALLLNMATDRHFLGITRGTVADADRPVVGTRDKFAWRLAPDLDGDSFCFTVPNSDMVMQATWTKSAPSASVFLSKRSSYKHQCWRLESPIVRPPVQSGVIYKIVSAPAGTVVHLEAGGSVAGHPYVEGKNQLWRALIQDEERPFLAAFQNYATGQYLSIDRDSESSVALENGTLLVGSPSPFDWQLVRDVADADGYRLLVPFSSINVDLEWGSSAPGTSIHLHDQREEKYWRFEEVPVMIPQSELATGPPERQTQ